jgi:oligopeptide transport system permease protein
MPKPSHDMLVPGDVAPARTVGQPDASRMLAWEVSAAPGGPPQSGRSVKPRSLWSDAWHDLRRNPMFIISALLILLLIVIAVFPGLFTSTDPKFCDLTHFRGGRAPGHPFGFDAQGCDIYARVIYGARASVAVGILVTTGVVLIGGVIGALAAFYGGIVDSLLSRFVDVFFAIPLLLGAIVFLQAFPFRNIWTVVAAIMLLGWPQMARIMRGAVISVKESDFVTAARALGASDMRILVRHILPNAIAPVIVVATISLGLFIVLEATLSFLGIGLPSSTVSWGGDINDAQSSLRSAPHVLLFPSVALSITVLAFMLLGDAVRDALDPKLR